MKRVVLALLVCFLLASLLFPGVPPVHASGHGNHCVCGGSAEGIHDHVCKPEQWMPLSSVLTMTAADWSKVPSGYYYLDADVTVTVSTDGYCIGSAVLNSDKITYQTAPKQVHLCLNGHTITTTTDRTFKGVYTNSVLSICDCSGRPENGIWQWNGTVKGGTSNNGGITYMYANSQVNIYGGNFTNEKTTGSGGGLFYVAQDRAAVGNAIGKESADYASTLNIYNGNLYGGHARKIGGNVYVAQRSSMHVYGGRIHDGIAGEKGGNIYVNGKARLTMENATVYNGTAAIESGNIHPITAGHYLSNNIYGASPEVAKCITGETQSREYTLENAISQCTEGSTIRLYRDWATEITVSKNIVLDLNGNDLSGTSGDFVCLDSATENGSTPGVLRNDGTVTAARGYVACTTDNGISFYGYASCTPRITHMSIAPDKAAIGYKASIATPEVLDQVGEFGMEMWLEGNSHRQFSKANTTGQLKLRLQDVLTPTNTYDQNIANAQTPVYAFPYVVLKDGTKLCGQTVSYSFRDMLHVVDDHYISLNKAQKDALQAMAGQYAQVMMTWDVENFHHAGDWWKEKTNFGFLTMLIKDGSYYRIPAGSYVLTQDVNIDTLTLKIPSDTTVNICLNGHTITGSKRLLHIYGTLNLCDCHRHTEEGGMTSSFTHEGASSAQHAAVFYTYHGSTFNLYGGHLRATGTLSTSGVGAVSHEALDTLPDEPAGVMNMYGGTISGGAVDVFAKADGTTTGGSGGLISVMHGATFNMYDGELHSGFAKKNGGGIVVGANCRANIYGGSIHDCVAANGGGIFATADGAITYVGANARVYNNTATSADPEAIGRGGNIYFGSDGKMTLENAAVYGGQADRGGGIYTTGAGQLTLSNALVYNCQATNGAGLYISGAGENRVDSGSKISGNISEKTGGNLYVSSTGNITLADATVSDGQASQGSDVYSNHGQLTLAGAVQISDLYLVGTTTVDTSAMSTVAKVGYSGEIYGLLCENPTLVNCFTVNDPNYIPKVIFDRVVAVDPDMEICEPAEGFLVGYGSACIDPSVAAGIPLSGYGNSAERLSTQIQESLYASATAMTDQDGNTVILVTCDLQRPQEEVTDPIRQSIAAATGVPFENILLSASHSHSTPDLYSSNALIKEYKTLLCNRFTQAAIQAMANRVPSGMETNYVDNALTPDGKQLNFVRHYKYRDADGDWQYCGDNFGVVPDAQHRTSDIFFHAAQGDHSVGLIRFDRGTEKDVVLCNFAAHPTMTGSSSATVISADYIGPLRDYVQAQSNCYFSFVQGAAGNMNPVSRVVDEHKYSRNQYQAYGEALGAIVVDHLTAMNRVETGSVQADCHIYAASVQKYDDEELTRAETLSNLYYGLETDADKQAALEQYGFTSIYHANSVIAKSKLGNTENLELNVISIGKSVAFYTAPGELWAETGIRIKRDSDFACTFTVGYCNGDWKYFPDGEAADGTYENYEFFYSRFVLPETTEDMIAWWTESLSRLYQKSN